MSKTKKHKRQERTLSAIALFSGCGGLDLGFKRAGFKVQLALDADAICAESYRRNFRSVPFVQESIEAVNDSLFCDAKQATGGEVSILFGGPPCPPYSKSRFYRKEKPRGLDDEVGQQTVDGYLRALRIIRPRAFLLENVPGLAYDVHSEALNYITGTACGLGYTCESAVLNAANYGVPQIRERFFLVGFQGGHHFRFPPQTHYNPSNKDLLSDTLATWRTAGDVLSDIDAPVELEGHFAGGKDHDLLREVPPGDNYLYFTAKRGYPNPKFKWRSRYWSFLLKLSPGMPSWTIQARRSNNMGPFHWRNRILTIEEVKRLQTFPDDWQLAGGVEQQWRQLGNAVPPILAEHLARSIAQQLEEQQLAASTRNAGNRRK
jgi:DNA (cytosine-5)-methyltransferase 1